MMLGNAWGAPWRLLGLTLTRTLQRGLSLRDVFRQFYETGNRSAALVASGMAFFGVVMVTIANQQAKKFTGNLTIVGPAYFELLVRELGPMLSALLAAARAGAFDTAELASMTVNEQVEALEMSGAEPLSTLVAPKVVASFFAVPILCVFGTLSASLAAVVTANRFDAIGLAFVDARYIDSADIACGLTKALLSGLYIPAAAAFRGLTAKGGAPGVGNAVTLGVVEACTGCLLIDFIVALAFLGVGA